MEALQQLVNLLGIKTVVLTVILGLLLLSFMGTRPTEDSDGSPEKGRKILGIISIIILGIIIYHHWI